MTQLDLPLAPVRRRGAKPLAASKIAARMIAVLAVRGTWTTRAEFAERGLSDRECRAGRRASHGRIIYGQRGFILLRDAKPDDIRACLASTLSMVRELEAEWRWTNRRAHGVLAGKERVK